MRWTSTILSAERGEVSVLALIETIGAVGVSILIAIYTETVYHIVIASCLAPFLLLRSPKSTILGMECSCEIVSFSAYWFRTVTGPVIVKMYGFVLFFIPALILSKILITIYCLIRHPVSSISQIPSNWIRIVLATDFLRPPEVFPGTERIWKRSGINRPYFPPFYHIFKAAKDLLLVERKLPGRRVVLFIFPIILVFAYFPSISYRLSLKSTSILWTPILWAVQPFSKKYDDSSYIISSSLMKLVRFYSVIVILLFTIKIMILSEILNVSFSGVPEIANQIIEPLSIPLWQVGAVFNAILTWIIYFYSEWHSGVSTGKFESSSRSSNRELPVKICKVVKNFISIYIISCTTYILYKYTNEINWIVFEFQFWPN